MLDARAVALAALLLLGSTAAQTELPWTDRPARIQTSACDGEASVQTKLNCSRPFNFGLKDSTNAPNGTLVYIQYQNFLPNSTVTIHDSSLPDNFTSIASNDFLAGFAPDVEEAVQCLQILKQKNTGSTSASGNTVCGSHALTAGQLTINGTFSGFSAWVIDFTSYKVPTTGSFIAFLYRPFAGNHTHGPQELNITVSATQRPSTPLPPSPIPTTRNATFGQPSLPWADNPTQAEAVICDGEASVQTNANCSKPFNNALADNSNGTLMYIQYQNFLPNSTVTIEDSGLPRNFSSNASNDFLAGFAPDVEEAVQCLQILKQKNTGSTSASGNAVCGSHALTAGQLTTNGTFSGAGAWAIGFMSYKVPTTGSFVAFLYRPFAGNHTHGPQELNITVSATQRSPSPSPPSPFSSLHNAAPSQPIISWAALGTTLMMAALLLF